MKRILLIFILFQPVSQAMAAKPGAIWAWQDDTVAEQVKVLEQGLDHPCGMTHKIELDRMPAADKAREMGLELVAEYARGAVVNRWVVPVDTVPLALDDENLIVSQPEGSLIINLQGFMTVRKKQQDTSAPVENCPSFLNKVFPGSDYLRCLKIPDKRTKKVRFLAYQGSCT